MSSTSKLIIVLFCTFLCVPIAHVYSQKSTGINNTNPNPKASLDVSTTGTQGVFIPRLPAAATKTALSPIASDAGLTFYGSDDNTFWYWSGTQWLALLSGTTNSGPWIKSGTNVLLTTATDNVGIGITPTAKLDIGGSIANNVQAIFTRGNGDQNFQLYAANGIASNASGTVQGQFGLRYAGVGDAASFTFTRGNGTQDASIVFNTNAAERMRINALGGIQIVGLAGAGNSLIQTDASGTLSRYSGASLAGTGTLNQIAYWTSSNIMSATNSMYWDATNKRLGIGTATPTNALDVAGGMVVGAGYAGVSTAPTNGLAVQGITSIGAASPFGTLNVDFLAFGNREIKLINSGFAHWSIINNATGAFQIGTSSSVSSIGAPVGSFFYISPSGYVGIGIASPSYALDVVGNARISGLVGPGVVTASSAGLLSVTPGTPVVGAGTTNYLTKWTPSGSALGSSIMYDNGTSVGIGTTTPAYLFTLVGTGSMFAVDNTANFVAKNTTGTYENYLWPRWSDNAMYINYGTGGLYIRNNVSTTTMFMTNTGNVGIGTTTPAAKLNVVGGGNTNIDLIVNGRIQTGDVNNNGGIWLSSAQDGFVGNNGANVGFYGSGSGWSFNMNKTNGAVSISTTSATQYPLSAVSSNTWGTALQISNSSTGGSTYNLVSVGSAHTGNPALPAGSFAISDILGNHAIYMYGGSSADAGSIVLAQNSSQRVGIGDLPISSVKHYIKSYDQAYGSYIRNDYTSGYSYGNYVYVYNTGGSTNGVYGTYSYGYTTGTGTAYGIYAGSFSSGGTEYAGYFGGNVYCSGSYLPSDRTLKENISAYSGALNAIKDISVMNYNYRDDGDYGLMNFPKGGQIGFIAQDLEKKFPHLIKEGTHPIISPEDAKDNQHSKNREMSYKIVNYDGMIPILTQAVKEQQLIIDQQKNNIDSLSTTLSNIKMENMKLSSEVEEIKKHLGMGIDVRNTPRTKKSISK